MGPTIHSRSFPGHCVASTNSWLSKPNCQYAYDIDCGFWVRIEGSRQYPCYSGYSVFDAEKIPAYNSISLIFDFVDDRPSQTHVLERTICGPCVYFNQYFALFFQGFQILLVGTGNEQLQGFVQHGSDGPGKGGYGDNIKPPPFMGHPYPVLPHRYYANTLDELFQRVNDYINHQNLIAPRGLRWFPNGGKTPTYGLGEEAYTVRYELPDSSTYLPLHPHGNEGHKAKSDVFRKSIAGWDFVKGIEQQNASLPGGTALYRQYPQYEVQTGIYEKSVFLSELPTNGGSTPAQDGQMFTDEDPTGSSGQTWGHSGAPYFIGLPTWSNFGGVRYRLISSRHGDLIATPQEDRDNPMWNILHSPKNFTNYGDDIQDFVTRKLGDVGMTKPCVKAYSQVTVQNVEPSWYITPPEAFTIIQRLDEDRVSATIYNAKSSPFIREKNNLTEAQVTELREHQELSGVGKITNKIVSK